MMAQRWMSVTEPQFPWERSALTYMRERIPDQDPCRAWSNFEFIAEDGSINEMDLLVVSLYKIYLDAGILKAEAFTEHERGPALIFEHDPDAVRLDRFLRHRGDQLDIGMRLALVRQIAEALRYAHERRLYHQTLSPQIVLVAASTAPEPQIKSFDWQRARRENTFTGSIRPTAGGSLHLDLFGDQQSLLYRAPDPIAGTAYDAPKLDVFALGTVAYHIFSGQAPATTIEELHQKCYQGLGQNTVREIRQWAERLARHMAARGEQPPVMPLEEPE
jgi:serine/threonine protein kinase